MCSFYFVHSPRLSLPLTRCCSFLKTPRFLSGLTLETPPRMTLATPPREFPPFFPDPWTPLIRTTHWPTHSPLTLPGNQILTWTDWPRYPWSWLPHTLWYKTHPTPTSLWTLDTQFLLHPLFLPRPWARTLTSWSLSGWEWRIEPAVAMIDVATDKTTITTFQGDQQFRTCASYEENALCCCFPGTNIHSSVNVFMTGPPHLQHRKEGNFWTGSAFPWYYLILSIPPWLVFFSLLNMEGLHVKNTLFVSEV